MDEERIALFLDYENLAIGVRDHLGGMRFDFKPIADALAERGRIIVRRAYADWSYFPDDRRDLTRHHIELIEIPQRMGAVRKNAADIKLAVDAVELCLERGYVTTFVLGTGDSDFTPLMHKLRELNRRVIGVGVRDSTSDLLPPACDEFLFYDNLEGVETPAEKRRRAKVEAKVDGGSERKSRSEEDELGVRITQTLSGLKRRSGDAVLSSQIKRTLLRKDPTFDEAEYGFRSFSELMRHLANQGAVSLSEGTAKGDPEVDFPESGSEETEGFELLRSVVGELEGRSGPPPLSQLKNELTKRSADFDEKRFGYGGFLQFCKAARAKGVVKMDWDEAADDYLLRAPEPSRA